MSFYDRRGQAICVLCWDARAIDNGYRTLKRTTIGPPGNTERFRISTAWTGLNVNTSGGPPLIFKTIVSGDRGEELEYTYATEEAACEGHTGIVHDLGAQVVQEHGMAQVRDLPPLLCLIKERE
jgi:hypothetical protein